ncbi:MAG: CocE/NonD family hydrolase, partial [Bacteroidales bacterium]|nr:CocE/NonD family hydrolase [Bacteroidales bacterium]
KKNTIVLPLSHADDSTSADVNFYNDWLLHEKYDEYWKYIDHGGLSKAPVLTMAGWYDIFLKRQISDFLRLEKAGITGSRLVIGPWAHGSLGEANEYGGLEKSGDPKLIFKYVIRHLRDRKDRLSEPLHDTKINLFIMERNEYVASDTWPPQETRMTPFYLNGSGSLSAEAPAENSQMQFNYDPSDPYPSHGGTALGNGVGPARQNSNSGRKDQLVFTKPVEKGPLVLLGPVNASLWLSSTAACTDFYVLLQDEFPDGKIINIQEGGAKVKAQGAKPHKTEISVWATGYQLNPGHTLRVVITSSWFPRFNRNLNNCEPITSATAITASTQTVWYGSETPSSIILPVYDISRLSEKSKK